MGIAIVRRLAAATTKLLLTLRSPCDGRPYWSLRRGAQAAAKVAGAVVIPGSGFAYKTDLWVGPKGLVLGGRTCKSCHKRTQEPAGSRCPNCGGPLIPIKFKLSDAEKAELKELKGIQAGEFPVVAFGVSRPGEGGGMFEENRKSGEEPLYGMPDEFRAAAEFILSRNRDILPRESEAAEQLIVIPKITDAQVLTDLDEAKTCGLVDVDLA